MTTCIAVNTNGRTGICADTLISSEHRKYGNLQKIIELQEEGLDYTTYIGIAGSTTMLMALTAITNATLFDFSSVQAVYESVLQIHFELKENHGLCTSEGGDSEPFESMQTELLIVNITGIYQVLSFREVLLHETLAAIGTGAEYALGAAKALLSTKNLDADQVASLSVQIATQYDKHSGLPSHVFDFENLE